MKTEIETVNRTEQLRQISHIIDTGVSAPNQQQDVYEWFQSNRADIKRYWNYNERSVYSQYYGNDNRVRYGLYAPILDRFIAVDRFDLHILHLTAKILSSKIVTVVCMFGNNRVDVNHANSLTYGISHKSFDISASQTPICVVLDQPESVTKVGWPKDYDDRISDVLNMKMWVHFTICAMYAAVLADRLINRSDHGFYRSMLETEADTLNNFATKVDGSGLSEGLVTYVSRALYNSNTIDEVLEKINELHFMTPPNATRNTTIEYFYSLFRGISTEIDDETYQASIDEIDTYMMDVEK
jgi:hypothetical protein